MTAQAAEELDHAMKLFGHLNLRGGVFDPKPIPAPKKGWNTCLDVVSEAFAHEQAITKGIHSIFEAAQALLEFAEQNAMANRR